MKLLIAALLLGLVNGCLAAADEPLQFLPAGTPPSVFGANAQKISLLLCNTGETNFDRPVRTQLVQTTSSTAVPLGVEPWKQLRVLPSQTVLETAQLNFPPVRAETRFLVQWLDDANRVLGVTSVLVYPTNLFQSLQPFLCQTNFGVLDPGNQLKPLLRAQKISFTDLGQMNLENFSGRLAIIGPFQSQSQVPDGLGRRIRAIAKKNVAVVWIQPPQPANPAAPLDWERKKIPPSFYSVQKSRTAVVVVQPDIVPSLPENPRSQIALIYCCKLALNPQPAVLPGLSPDFDH